MAQSSDITRALEIDFVLWTIEREKAMDWKLQYAKLVNALENEMFVLDNTGSFWYYDGEKIRLALADVEEPKDAKENGYFCDSFDEGLKVLIEGGYI